MQYFVRSNPLPGDVHVNQLLTQISVAYLQDQANFVAATVFPNIPVQKQSDRYFTIDRGDFNRDEMDVRAPGTESKGSGYRLDTTPTYFANVYAFHHDIPAQLRANADNFISLDRQATQFVSMKALIRREKLWNATFFQSGVWATEWPGVASGAVAGTNVLRWSDAASDPIGDVARARDIMSGTTGYEPNTLVIGRTVYTTIAHHPQFMNRVLYGGTNDRPAMINKAAMAALFEVDQILVMNGIENVAAEGIANAHQRIGGPHALLCYVPAEPGLMTPAAGYTFSWVGYTGATGPQGNTISSWWMQNIKSDRVEIEMAFDMKRIAADMGVFFYNIL